MQKDWRTKPRSSLVSRVRVGEAQHLLKPTKTNALAIPRAFRSEIMTKPRRDWAWKLYVALGYRVAEDEEDFRALNRAIKGIIQSERQRKPKKVR